MGRDCLLCDKSALQHPTMPIILRSEQLLNLHPKKSEGSRMALVQWIRLDLTH